MKALDLPLLTRTAVSALVLISLCATSASAQKGSNPGDAADRATRIFNEAETLRQAGTVTSVRASLPKYSQALELYRQAGDKRGEATTLSRMGFVHSGLNERWKAVEAYFRAVPLLRELGDRRAEALTHNNLGILFSLLGEFRKSLISFGDALPLVTEMGDRMAVVVTLNNIGAAHRNLGEGAKALEFFSRALPLVRQLGNLEGEAVTLSNIGSVHMRVGDYGKALEHSNGAIVIFRRIGDKQGEAMALNDVGLVLRRLGESRRALEIFGRALSLVRTVGDRGGEATALGNIGETHNALGERQKALEFLNGALPIQQTLGDRAGEARTLNNIGFVHSDLGEKQKALDFYNRALPIQLELGDRAGEAMTLTNIGSVYSDLGERRMALEFFNRSLPKLKAVGYREAEAACLNNLMLEWWDLKNPRLAILYGKQAVNVYQQLRKAIDGLDRDTQKSYLTAVGSAYRNLADILASEGRFAEAQQVLGLLKEEEYAGYVRRDADEIKALSARADLRPEERTALEKYERLAGRVTEHGAAFMKLEELKRRQGADFLQQAEYDDLKSKLDAANAAFRIFLEKEIAEQFPKNVKKEIELDRALQGRLAKWGEGTVALYTVMGEDRYRVILTTPKVQVDGKTEIKAADLNRKIFAYREALRNPGVDPRPLGRELYDILVKPIEKDLAAAGAKTLLWSLDGALRYIPLGTLSPDGETYLVERFRNVVVTSTIRQNLSLPTVGEWRVLGAGVTKESRVSDPVTGDPVSFSALPGVGRELDGIVREEREDKGGGILGGTALLDEAFDAKTLGERMSSGASGHNVVHLATHFRLGADNARSFLLVGGNRALTLADISDDTNLSFTDVELVTLSACDTAFGTAAENRGGAAGGNGAEVDSLATFIELRGAKAVMASLWPVVDESTSLLMTEFYRIKAADPSVTKAEAMQRAQLAMISGALKSTGAGGGCRSDGIEDNPNVKSFPCRSDAPFSHPYFWSPFVLIGNWR